MRSELPLFQSQLLIRPGEDLGGVDRTLYAIGNGVERVGALLLPPQKRYTVVVDASGLSELVCEQNPLAKKKNSLIDWLVTAAKIIALFPLLLAVALSKFVRRSSFAILLAKAAAKQQEAHTPHNQPYPDLYKGCGTIESVLRKTLSEVGQSPQILLDPSSVWGKAALILLLHSKIEDGKLMKWGEVSSGRPTIYLATPVDSSKEIEIVAPDLLNGRNKPCNFDEMLELAAELKKLEEEEIELTRQAIAGEAPSDCPQVLLELAKRIALVGDHLKECHSSYALHRWSSEGCVWEFTLSIDLPPPDRSLFSKERASIRNFEELWRHELRQAAASCPASYASEKREEAVHLLALYNLLRGAIRPEGEKRVLWLTPHLCFCFSPIFEVKDPESYPDGLLSDLHPLFLRSSETESPLAHDIAYQLARRLDSEKATGRATSMWAHALSQQLKQCYPEITLPTIKAEELTPSELPPFVQQCLTFSSDTHKQLKKNALDYFTPAEPDRPLPFEEAAEFCQAEYASMKEPHFDNIPAGNCMLVALLTAAGAVSSPLTASLEEWTQVISQQRSRLALETRKQAQRLKRLPLETSSSFLARQEGMRDRATEIENNAWMSAEELHLLATCLGRSIMILPVAFFPDIVVREPPPPEGILEGIKRQQFFLNRKNLLLPSSDQIFHPSSGPTQDPIVISYNGHNHYHPVKKTFIEN